MNFLLLGFYLNKNDPILYVKCRVETNDLNAAEKIFSKIQSTTQQQQVLDQVFDLTPTVRVNNLQIDSINNISWNDFIKALFLKNRDKTVQGRLVMQSKVIVNHLKTAVLNGLLVSNLFNLKHPQVINSELTVSRLFVKDLKTKTINGLIFEDDVVFSGNDCVIESKYNTNLPIPFHSHFRT